MRNRLAALLIATVVATGLVGAPRSAEAAGCADRVYYQGATGTCVKYAQILFNSMHENFPEYRKLGSYYIAADGIVGRNTSAQSYVAQRWYNSWHSQKAKVDGILGPQTYTILCYYAYQDFSGYWGRQAEKIGHAACEV